jgi:dihydrodipicolinate reductase
MPDRKIIAVAGATGAQGGGVIRAILKDKDSPFSARAITRDPTSDKARALADLGAQVVQADLHDAASAIPFDTYRALGFPAADEMGNMYQFYADFEKDVAGARDVAFSRELNPELEDFDQWLERNKDRIPR